MSLEDELRRIVREEVRAALRDHGFIDGKAIAASIRDSAGKARRGPEPPAQPTLEPAGADLWQRMESVKIQGTGSRSYYLNRGNPCKVRGEGRGGGIGSGFTVISIQKHRDTGKVNVEVRKDRNGHSRIFPLDKIVYMRRRDPR